MRNIIVHCHMFKNAGSTLDWSLARSFGKQFCDHRNDEPMKNEEGYLTKYLEKNSHLTAISSHHVVPPFGSMNDARLLPIYILRNPIDRVGSVYEFERKQSSGTPGAKYAKKHTLDEYVQWRMLPDVGSTIRSFQVRYCSGGVKRAKIDNTDYEKALVSLLSSPLTGIVERYDESMVLFEDFLRPLFPKIDLAYVAQNLGKRRQVSIEDRIETVLSQLSQETQKLLLENNYFDEALYSSAGNILDERIKLIDKFDEKLVLFKQRCSNLK